MSDGSPCQMILSNEVCMRDNRVCAEWLSEYEIYGMDGTNDMDMDMYVCMHDRLGVGLGERANKHGVVDGMQCAKKETNAITTGQHKTRKTREHERVDGGQV